MKLGHMDGDPQLAGALGAALFAKEKALKEGIAWKDGMFGIRCWLKQKKAAARLQKNKKLLSQHDLTFVLKGNTAVDLGENPEQSFLTFSESPSEFDSGVYLVGKDVNELVGSQPLAMQLNVVGARIMMNCCTSSFKI